MPLPNTLIVGAQKCGTTWLHVAMSKSQHVFASDPKELNFFNTSKYIHHVEDYMDKFNDEDSEVLIESTPHYFRSPAGAHSFNAQPHNGENTSASNVTELDIPRNIKSLVPDAKCIVLLRDPVERYLSAYIHHVQFGRFPYQEEIDHIVDSHNLIYFGMYADILTHWHRYFPGIHVVSYDDVCKDPAAVVSGIEDFIGVRLGLTDKDLDFRTNDADQKIAHKLKFVPQDVIDGWKGRPQLTDRARRELEAIYDDQIAQLAGMVDFDVAHWRGVKP